MFLFSVLCLCQFTSLWWITPLFPMFPMLYFLAPDKAYFSSLVTGQRLNKMSKDLKWKFQFNSEFVDNVSMYSHAYSQITSNQDNRKEASRSRRVLSEVQIEVILLSILFISIINKVYKTIIKVYFTSHHKHYEILIKV